MYKLPFIYHQSQTMSTDSNLAGFKFSNSKFMDKVKLVHLLEKLHITKSIFTSVLNFFSESII